MGILNVTPDSFSDGGQFNSVDAAVNHAKEMVADGADIIDIGAESTRPGFTPISADEEISRIEKIIPAIKNLGVPISIDTYKPEVAAYALKLGANIINDVDYCDAMAQVAKDFGVPIIIMHNRKFQGNVIADIKNFFRQTLEACDKIGLQRSQIIFDAGIGFNKSREDDLTILRNLRGLKVDNIPMLLGVSRKRVLGYVTGLDVDERDDVTGAVCVWAITQGVDIVRVHNVKLIAKMCKMADCLIGVE